MYLRNHISHYTTILFTENDKGPVSARRSGVYWSERGDRYWLLMLSALKRILSNQFSQSHRECQRFAQLATRVSRHSEQWNWNWLVFHYKRTNWINMLFEFIDLSPKNSGCWCILAGTCIIINLLTCLTKNHNLFYIRFSSTSLSFYKYNYKLFVMYFFFILHVHSLYIEFIILYTDLYLYILILIKFSYTRFLNHQQTNIKLFIHL